MKKLLRSVMVVFLFGFMLLWQKPMEVIASATTPLSISTSYPDTVTCGGATTFTVTASGGSGNYKYRLGNVSRMDDGVSYYVVDPSRAKYQDSNVFEFTFMASGTYRLDFYVMDMTDYAYKREIVNLTINDPNYPTIESIADQVVEQCISEGNTTEYEKALWLHDWVISHVTYDNSMMYCGPEGVFARGTGICESYHRAYVMLLNRVGIESARITGNGHVWTGVKLDGKWYHVDATWDDPGYVDTDVDVNHLYFGLNDEIITLVHSEHTPREGYESNDIKNNYFYKNGKLGEWVAAYMEDAKNELSNHRENFSIPVKNKAWVESYKNVINNLIKYQLEEELVKNLPEDVRVSNLGVEYQSDEFIFTVTYLVGEVVPDGGDNNQGSGEVSTPDPTPNPIPEPTPEPESKPNFTPKGSWQRNHVGWWYQNADGSYPCNEWSMIDDKWYHFDARGYMQTGWIYLGNTWYYLESSGAMLCNQWGYINGKWYHFDGSGAMQTGWILLGGTWYYLESSGAMLCNQWGYINGKWYHFDGSGAMQTGWILLDGTWYYLESSGAMLSNQWGYINGEWYYFRASGAMASNTWVGIYYVDSSGRYTA